MIEYLPAHTSSSNTRQRHRTTPQYRPRGCPKWATSCPISRIFDEKHRQLTGPICRFKHEEYNWPASTAETHCFISDSIGKFVNNSLHIHTIAFPGITTERLFWKIKLGLINLSQYKTVTVHVGTNDLQRLPKENIVKAVAKLIKLIRHKNQEAKIIISGIIPRPTDTKDQDDKRRQVNKSLNNLAK